MISVSKLLEEIRPISVSQQGKDSPQPIIPRSTSFQLSESSLATVLGAIFTMETSKNTGKTALSGQTQPSTAQTGNSNGNSIGNANVTRKKRSTTCDRCK
jgi:hypothetical protein